MANRLFGRVETTNSLGGPAGRGVAAAVAACLLIAALATAGTIRDDVPDSSYTNLAAQPQYASVGELLTNSQLGTGTLIGSRWVLTAAHVISFPDPTSMT